MKIGGKLEIRDICSDKWKTFKYLCLVFPNVELSLSNNSDGWEDELTWFNITGQKTKTKPSCPESIEDYD